MKPWKAVVALCSLGFIILVVVGLMGGLRVEEKSTASGNATNSKQVTTATSSSSKSASVKIETEGTKEASATSSTSSSSVPSVSVKEVEGTTTEPSTGSTISGVNYPNIVSEGGSNGVITEKKVYKVNNTYIFNLRVTLAIEGRGTVDVDYFTSANNYNSVKVGDLLYIEYGVDNEGNVAVAVADTVKQ